jgi:hypothetical protein
LARHFSAGKSKGLRFLFLDAEGVEESSDEVEKAFSTSQTDKSTSSPPYANVDPSCDRRQARNLVGTLERTGSDSRAFIAKAPLEVQV